MAYQADYLMSADLERPDPLVEDSNSGRVQTISFGLVMWALLA